mgnify:FL=1
MKNNIINPALTVRICMDLAFFTRKLEVKVLFLESCTGGLASSWISSFNGSSSWFEGSLVTYSNRMKNIFLKISEKELLIHGAVSDQVASSMANSLLKQKVENIVTSSITGIAGPSGGSQKKPVGLVFFGWAGPWGVDTSHKKFTGNRQQIREEAAKYAIINLAKRVALNL